jgi:hypothetical protein
MEIRFYNRWGVESSGLAVAMHCSNCVLIEDIKDGEVSWVDRDRVIGPEPVFTQWCEWWLGCEPFDPAAMPTTTQERNVL